MCQTKVVRLHYEDGRHVNILAAAEHLRQQQGHRVHGAAVLDALQLCCAVHSTIAEDHGCSKQHGEDCGLCLLPPCQGNCGRVGSRQRSASWRTRSGAELRAKRLHGVLIASAVDRRQRQQLSERLHQRFAVSRTRCHNFDVGLTRGRQELAAQRAREDGSIGVRHADHAPHTAAAVGLLALKAAQGRPLGADRATDVGVVRLRVHRSDGAHRAVLAREAQEGRHAEL
mmetsp:Transcript_96768/g.289021  ORF Transcript_96768/g.289021 Transcript_96768/m.289021 type:complete len:228 (-) Transcript_96768:195-878(-)